MRKASPKKNTHRVDGSTAYLYCPNPMGMFHEVAVSTSDLKRVLAAGYWHVANCYPKGFRLYAYLTTQPMTYLHRFITDAPKGMVVDHINHDGIDNRSSNLRVVTKSENQWNRAVRIGTVTKKKNRYEASAAYAGKHHYVGSFLTKEEARAAATAFARELGGRGAGIPTRNEAVEAPCDMQFHHSPAPNSTPGGAM